MSSFSGWWSLPSRHPRRSGGDGDGRDGGWSVSGTCRRQASLLDAVAFDVSLPLSEPRMESAASEAAARFLAGAYRDPAGARAGHGQ